MVKNQWIKHFNLIRASCFYIIMQPNHILFCRSLPSHSLIWRGSTSALWHSILSIGIGSTGVRYKHSTFRPFVTSASPLWRTLGICTTTLTYLIEHTKWKLASLERNDVRDSELLIKDSTVVSCHCGMMERVSGSTASRLVAPDNREESSQLLTVGWVGEAISTSATAATLMCSISGVSHNTTSMVPRFGLVRGWCRSVLDDERMPI